MAANNSIHRSRLCRKLPKVGQLNTAIPSGHSPVFWLNFPSALQWIRKNEDTISKFVQLLRIHPNLIQDGSLDVFWEFMEPLLQQQNEAKCFTVTKKNLSSANHLKAVLNKRTSGKGVPVISVTQTRESPLPTPIITSKKARTPRVHLISGHSLAGSMSPSSESENTTICKQNLLHHGVLDMLQEHFYVRKTHPGGRCEGQQSSQDNRNSQLYRLSESDVCVYLFNDSTVNDAGCFHDLCTALALNIPVIYSRHHSQELPKTFAESVQHISRGCVYLSDYIVKFVLGGSELGETRVDRRKYAHSGKKIASLSVRTRSSSASDLNTKGFNFGCGKMQKLSKSDTDILLYLVNNFQTSYVFDEHDVLRCSRHLRRGIYHSIGISENDVLPAINSSHQNYKNGGRVEETTRVRLPAARTEQNFNGELEILAETDLHCKKPSMLKVPDADNMLLAREWSNSGSVSAPPNDNPGQDGRFTYEFHEANPAPLEEKSTTYLVFDDKNVQKKIRRIHFPLDDKEVTEGCYETGDTDSDEFDPGGSPIQFTDIDLAREINASMDTPELEL